MYYRIARDALDRDQDETRYLDYLKSYSGTLLKQSPYKFFSRLPDVNAYINRSNRFIKESDVMRENHAIGAVDFIQKFANA